MNGQSKCDFDGRETRKRSLQCSVTLLLMAKVVTVNNGYEQFEYSDARAAPLSA